MICAEDELGLGQSHDGILVLDSALPPGMPLDRIPGLCDTVYEINVTPNRPDALCHVGVARELAAKFGKPLRYPTSELKEQGPEAAGLAEVVLEDKLGCTQYIGRVIQGIKVGPSPEWLVKALKSLGKRSINNVVDLTNFVLLELGQPSHAFDLDKISGRRVIIRRAEPGERLVTLDDVERTLTADDLVIADAKGPMVLAGVMGGKATEVDAGSDQYLPGGRVLQSRHGAPPGPPTRAFLRLLLPFRARHRPSEHGLGERLSRRPHRALVR